MFKYFSSKEFLPNCTADEIYDCLRFGFFDDVLRLIRLLDEFREHIKAPIVITSSFRNFEHNRLVGGSVTSQHLKGQAIDFKCPSKSFFHVVCALDDFLISSGYEKSVGQIILYHKKQFIHLALPTTKYPSKHYFHYEQGNN